MSLKPFGVSHIERAIDRVGRGYFHIPAYAGLAALAVLALPAGWKARRRALAGAIAATACGWGLELAQRLTPDRTFNIQGLAFDAAGAAVGAAVAWVIIAWSDRGAATRRMRRGGTEDHNATS